MTCDRYPLIQVERPLKVDHPIIVKDDVLAIDRRNRAQFVVSEPGRAGSEVFRDPNNLARRQRNLFGCVKVKALRLI